MIRFARVGEGGFGTALGIFFKMGIVLISFGFIGFPSGGKHTNVRITPHKTHKTFFTRNIYQKKFSILSVVLS